MDLLNPFNRKQTNNHEEKLMVKQAELGKDAEVFNAAVQPTSTQEDEMFRDHQAKMAELTKWQQDLSPMLSEMFTNLCGYRFDRHGAAIKVAYAAPLCNIKGARRLVDTVKPLDKNVMNGAWTIKQINDMMIALDETNVQDIIEHWRQYEIEYSVATMDRICETVLFATYPTFLRGLENGERRFHSQIQKLIETKSLEGEKKKPTLFGKA